MPRNPTPPPVVGPHTNPPAVTFAEYLRELIATEPNEAGAEDGVDYRTCGCDECADRRMAEYGAALVAAPRLTGNQRRRQQRPAPVVGRFELVSTAHGLVLERNAFVIYGEWIARHRLTQLSPEFYGRDAYTRPDLVALDYRGRALREDSAEQFGAGQYLGQYFFSNNAGWRSPNIDPDALRLLGRSGRAHRDDPHSILYNGRAVLHESADFRFVFPALMDSGTCLAMDEDVFAAMVDEEGTFGPVHVEYLVYVGPQSLPYLNDRDLLARLGFGFSEYRRRWWPLDHAGFYDQTSGNAGYHGLRRISRTNMARFTVGFEVEKEDEVLIAMPYAPLLARTEWAKERDGSLNEYTGYELVSPAYDLMSDQLDVALADEGLAALVNARFTRACGGHIHFGIRDYSEAETLNAVSGFLPLIYAMHPGRARGTHNQYAAAKKVARLHCPEDEDEDSNPKYVSVRLLPGRVEFRVFGAVRDVRNLLWRRDLIRLIARNLHQPAETVLASCLDGDSPLHQHLSRVYSPAKLLGLVGRAVDIHQLIEERHLNVALQLTNLVAVPADTEYLIA